jgi:RNA polymerase primary sigma factor
MTFDPVRSYFREIRKIPILTAEEERRLAYLSQNGSEKASKQLIRSNLRLVIKIAKKYSNLGLPFPDLIEEGNIGLIKAVKKYDPRLGYRFSTYAAWWIRQHVIRAIANQARVVRIPVYMNELIHKWRKVTEKLTHRFGRKPKDSELAKELKIPVKKVGRLKQLAQRATSLDVPISEEGEAEFIDLIRDDEIAAMDELVNLFEREKVDELLSMMDERERDILEMRFGLKDGITKTLAETARRFGVTRERIRQIEKDALDKMKKILSEDKEEIKVEKRKRGRPRKEISFSSISLLKKDKKEKKTSAKKTKKLKKKKTVDKKIKRKKIINRKTKRRKVDRGSKKKVKRK